MNNDEENLGYLLNKSTKMIRSKFNEKLKEYELTSSQWAVIRDIYYQGKMDEGLKNVSPAAIAQRLYIDRPTISGIMERLSKKEWVIVRTNLEDRRSLLISLTDKSRDLMMELEKLGDNSMEHAVQGFDDSEIEELKGYLQRIINNLS